MLAEAFSVGSFMIPGFVILVLLAAFLIAKAMANRYQRIPPNQVAIIYGRGTKTVGEGQIQGCKVVSGGGVLVWPIFRPSTSCRRLCLIWPSTKPTSPTRKT